MFLSAFMNMIFRVLVPAPFLQGRSLAQQTTSIAHFLKPDTHAAYDQCLQNQVEVGDNATLLMYAHCLGFLIIEAPDDAARYLISNKIVKVDCQCMR